MSSQQKYELIGVDLNKITRFDSVHPPQIPTPCISYVCTYHTDFGNTIEAGDRQIKTDI